MFDRRLRLSSQVAEEAITYFGDVVYKSVIPRNVRLSECPSFGKPVLMYDVQSAGARSYLKLAQEIIEKQQGKGYAGEAIRKAERLTSKRGH
jgi:chromosome partitioning protein